MRSLVLSRRCAVLEERWTMHGRGSVVASHGAAEVPAGLPLWTRPEGAAPLACAAAVRRRRTGTCARVDSAPSRKGEAAARGARCGGGLARCSPRCPRACFCGPQARCGAAPTTTCVRRRRAWEGVRSASIRRRRARCAVGGLARWVWWLSDGQGPRLLVCVWLGAPPEKPWRRRRPIRPRPGGGSRRPSAQHHHREQSQYVLVVSRIPARVQSLIVCSYPGSRSR